ncbi:MULTISPECIES: hypothetical protein [Streptomyces]|uniref:Uncharacterized protein n=1 Tax=Streptomyces sviceus (strain ATCC 29083 / DSM 924 / JCM 4929 / NBRC 13980 / NCIMB 11184 / NRRL 5439 / UC 5370) TaxID=463191 RepID=B5I8Z0_STRX2|nr:MULTISPECIES: hypothetical protein [Streptomyces]EDY61545.1 conserved hypothetical protein [Streptomyces sviceus ATCC 29083]MYT03274.1 hypothetical protein [Streptomyces sp. SID5470]
MTATSTIDEIVRLRRSTSTGFPLSGVIDSVLQPVSNLPGTALVRQLTGNQDVGQTIQSALDEEPADLYVTTDPHAGADHAVWPGDSTFSAAAGAQIPLGIQLTADGSQEVFAWDQDDVSADDLLRSVTISEDEQGGGSLSKLAHSEEERSYYYVQYHVD